MFTRLRELAVGWIFLIVSLFIDNQNKKYYYKITNLFEKLRTI